MARLGTGLSEISLGNFTEIRVGAIGSGFGDLLILEDVQSVGDLQDEATIIDVNAYGQKYMKKLVGSANASALEVVCNFNPSAPIQAELLAAYANTTSKMIAIAMFEATTGANGDEAEGTYNMFPCLIASASVANSFDETRTVTFSLVPANGIGEYEYIPV
jgi:hypothetical protein